MARKTKPELERTAWCARTFHICMILVFLAVLVLSLVSLAVFALRHNQIRGDACPECGSCILYAEVSEDDMIRLSSGTATSCAFAIWGEGIIAAIALVLGLMALVKVCIKWKVVSWLVVLELIAVGVALLIGFVIGIIISTGLRQTCGAFSDESELTGNFTISCDQEEFPRESDNRFYSDINTAQVTAWIGVGVLAFITVLYILIVVIYCCKGKKYEDDTESYQPKRSKSPKSSKVSKARTSSSSTKKVSEDDKAPKAFRAQDKTSRTETEQ